MLPGDDDSYDSREFYPGSEGVCAEGVAARLPEVSGGSIRLLRPVAGGVAEDGKGCVRAREENSSV